MNSNPETIEVLTRLGYRGHNKFIILTELKNKSMNGDIQAIKDLAIYQAYLKWDEDQYQLAERRGMELGESFY